MTITLHTLPKLVQKKKKRLGRGIGSGKGVKSGKGTTRHQSAREDIPLHFEGGKTRFLKIFPLLRGKGRNKSIQAKALPIPLERLNAFEDGETVTVASLYDKKIIQKNDLTKPVKIVMKGTLSKKLTIAVPFSASVQQAVEAQGGVVS